jgi:hypothetical protein
MHKRTTFAIWGRNLAPIAASTLRSLLPATLNVAEKENAAANQIVDKDIVALKNQE